MKPDTILRWQRKLAQQKWGYSERRQWRAGRPRKSAAVEELVCRLARENTWGYKRIRGELTKLGVGVSASCIADIVRRNARPPSPERSGLTWREFLSRHADVPFVMHLESRTIQLGAGFVRTALIPAPRIIS